LGTISPVVARLKKMEFINTLQNPALKLEHAKQEVVLSFFVLPTEAINKYLTGEE
jgi:hypothetical protein